jgi:vanillate O-demethylase ferredoxin subunit
MSNKPLSQLLRVRVARRWAECDDVVAFELAAVGGVPLPPFEAGAHVDVHLPGGPVRPYSLCNAPGQPHYQIAVLRESAGRGGSAAMHDTVHQGAELSISPPRNLFALSAHAPHHLLLAGGIGVTPLLAMAEALHAQGASFALHHACRSAARSPFATRLAAAPYAAQVRRHLDNGPAAQRLDLPALLAAQPAQAHLYVCGPAGFMAAVQAAAQAAGWDAARLHSESFQPAAPEAATQGGGFEVQLGHGGRVVPVAAGQTVVAALAAAGVQVLTSCEQGVCGTCLTRVLAGQPEHHDQYLTDAERQAGDQFLPCCSRARSARLVLDLAG